MSDRRSAIRSTDNRAEKHVAFRSPLMSVRNITPNNDIMMQFDNLRSPTTMALQQQQQNQSPRRLPSTDSPQVGTPAKQRRVPVDSAQRPLANASFDMMMQFENLRSPAKAHHQQNPSPKRPSSTNSPQVGTPAKQRRAAVDAVQLPLAPATLDDAVVRNTLRVQMIAEKVDGIFGQIPSIFDVANATLDRTSDIVLGLHQLDNVMYSYIEKEKDVTGTLNKFLKDLNEAEELDLSEFTAEFEKIEQALDVDIDHLNRLIAEEEEHDKESANL